VKLLQVLRRRPPLCGLSGLAHTSLILSVQICCDPACGGWRHGARAPVTAALARRLPPRLVAVQYGVMFAAG